MTEKTDTILQNIKKGDINEFENLFKLYYPLLCYYALKFVKDSDLAKEIVQDLFCKIWEDREKLNIHTSFKAYLYRSTYLNCLQYLRKRGSKKQYEEHVKNNSVSSHISKDIEEKEIQIIIHETLLSLPDRCGIIFKMSRFDGFKYHEIADKLSISVKTVESNMGKALKAFRKNLKDYLSIIVL
nr:RNA polymerase sigma-70 factor [uncultured Marinifilum sp.]